MVSSCFVCKWRGDKLPRRSFHRLPSNADLKQKWLNKLGKSNGSIRSHTLLCSIHFGEDCFREVNGRRILKGGSIPTLHLKNKKQKLTTDLVEIEDPVPLLESTLHTANITEATQTFEHTYRKETDNHDELPYLSMYDEKEPNPSHDIRKENDKTHPTFRCSVCNCVITEFRYECVQCSDVLVCSACGVAGAHQFHYLLGVPANRPLDEAQLVLAMIRGYLKDIDSKTITERDWDDSLSIKSEVQSEYEVEVEIPAAGPGSERAVSWAECEQEGHTNYFTNVRLKLASENESYTVEYTSAEEGDSNDRAGIPRDYNVMVIEQDGGTDGGTSYSFPTASRSAVDALDGATTAKKICIRPALGSDIATKESRVPQDTTNPEQTDVADNSIDNMAPTNITSIKFSSIFTTMDDDEFTRNYRMTKRSVIEICNLTGKKKKFNTNRNECLVPLEQLITLRYYGTGESIRTIARTHGVSIDSATRAVKRVSRSIAKLQDKYIYMPTSCEDVERCQSEFYNVANFPYVLGCIDCTHVKIHSPGGENCNIYKNNKGYSSLNVQLVTDSKLRIRDVVAQSPGSSSDAEVFKDSLLRKRFENGDFGNACLLGDSAYPLKNYLLTPYLQIHTKAQWHYNKSHSKTRRSVEKLHRMLKTRFPALAVGLRINLPTAIDMVIACCILHNICIENGEDVPPHDMDSTELEDLIRLGRIDRVYDQPGDKDRRKKITREIYSNRGTPK